MEGHDVVACDSVFESAESAGVFGDIAADGADFQGARIWGIEESVFGGLFVDALGDDSWLGSEKEVVGGDVEDLVHVHGAEDDGAWGGDATAAESGSGASGDDGYFVG